MLTIIRSMYSSTTSFVKACSNQSEPFVCNLGVRQGECLSPFLFAMYINDLKDEIVHKGVGLRTESLAMPEAVAASGRV